MTCLRVLDGSFGVTVSVLAPRLCVITFRDALASWYVSAKAAMALPSLDFPSWNSVDLRSVPGCPLVPFLETSGDAGLCRQTSRSHAYASTYWPFALDFSHLSSFPSPRNLGSFPGVSPSHRPLADLPLSRVSPCSNLFGTLGVPPGILD